MSYVLFTSVITELSFALINPVSTTVSFLCTFVSSWCKTPGLIRFLDRNMKVSWLIVSLLRDYFRYKRQLFLD